MRSTRRNFLASALMAPTGLTQAASSTQPNFVFILADDLGYADLSCYGRRDYSTPNLDRLAAQGMRFTQAYANSCVCSPTRAALITGRYQYRLPVGLEEPLAAARMNIAQGLPADHPTLPSLLREAGYQTSLIGKWHLGWLPNSSPNKSGYDSFYGYRSGGVDYFTHKNGALTSSPDDLWENDTIVQHPGYLTDLLGNRAVNQIESFGKSKKPFLMSLHFSAPHWPWEGPEDSGRAQKLKTLFDHEGGSPSTYASIVKQMDLQVGRVLQALEKNGSAKNTVVVFTSDNGGERFSDNFPFTGRKSELLEGGLRVPAIIRWPGQIPAGKTTDQVTITMDWMPTLLGMAGVAADAKYPLDGEDLGKVLKGAAKPSPRKLFWRYRNNAQRAFRDGDMKWLSINDNRFLFNLAKDPMERANLKDAEPEIFAGMAKQFERWNATMLPEDPAATTYGFGASQLADHYKNPLK